jgi:hypothetical protein
MQASSCVGSTKSLRGWTCSGSVREYTQSHARTKVPRAPSAASPSPDLTQAAAFDLAPLGPRTTSYSLKCKNETLGSCALCRLGVTSDSCSQPVQCHGQCELVQQQMLHQQSPRSAACTRLGFPRPTHCLAQVIEASQRRAQQQSARESTPPSFGSTRTRQLGCCAWADFLVDFLASWSSQFSVTRGFDRGTSCTAAGVTLRR